MQNKKRKAPDFQSLSGVKVGDTVVRWVAHVIPHSLKVSMVEDGYIHCGPWAFSQETGCEIDDVLGWHQGHSGSTLRLPANNDESKVQGDE